DDGNVFVITGVGVGTLAGKTSGWSNMQSLSGGSGADSFTFNNAGSVTGSVNGAGDVNTLTGDADGNVFVITGVGVGTLAGKTSGWSNVQNLIGGAGLDSFTLGSGGVIGSVDGAAGADVVSLVGSGQASDVVMSAARAGTLTHGVNSFSFSNTETLNAEVGQSNSLTFSGIGVTVSINGLDAGNSGGAGVIFTEFGDFGWGGWERRFCFHQHRFVEWQSGWWRGEQQSEWG
ncbi:MAG: hypothetical protein HC904_12500, partial [Blastochloris sp.]|nr:hypothetical protein [Blastochloris sp.]